MQKKLIALAVAGLASTAAFAADNVSMYGVADVYLGRFAADGSQTAWKLNSGGIAGSRLGVKGVEELGSGLKAVAVLEYAINMDANSGIGAPEVTAANTVAAGTQARQQMLALAGDFGTVAGGRLQTAGYDWDLNYNVFAGTALNPLNNVIGTNFKIGAQAGHARANNAMAYISPNMNGFSAAVNYAFAAEESANNFANSNKITATLLSLNYANGPLSAGLVYDKQAGTLLAGADATLNTANALLGAQKVAPGAAGAVNTTDWAFGVGYNFGVANVKLTYQTTKNNDGVNDSASANGQDYSATNKAWSLSAAFPVSGNGTVLAGYAKLKNNTGVVYNAAAGSTASGSADARSWTLAYLQALSKRTTAYVGYTTVSSDVGRYTNAAASFAASTSGLSSISSNVLAAGLSHKF